MERQWLTLDQIKAEYASNDYNPEMLLQHLLHHVEASPASAPEGYAIVPVEILDRFPEINPSNYDHDGACALNAWGVELVLSAAPTPPVSEDRKDAERYRWLRKQPIDDLTVPGIYVACLTYQDGEEIAKTRNLEHLDAAIDKAMQEDKS